MEVSLRRSPDPRHAPDRPPAAGAVPDLRVWRIDHLLLHEQADTARVRRLEDALRRDGVLRNPPIAAPLPDGRAVVLDGANRVTALRSLGLPHAVVQVVPYDDARIMLSVWRHYAAESTPGALRAAAAAAGIEAVVAAGGEAAAESHIAAGDGIAAIVDAQGAAVLRDPGRGAAAADALRRVVALYHGRPVHRTEDGRLDELAATYGAGALILFRRFVKSEIVALALGGGCLPAGITRHVIPGRALRLNTPLAWLADAGALPIKQAALDAQLRQRWQAHGVRHYAEPTFLFDE